jgi:hypothetical protein
MGHIEELLKESTDDAKSVTFRMTETERVRLTEACKTRGLDRGEFIRAAVLDGLAKLEQ